jgi:hypothetical protein
MSLKIILKNHIRILKNWLFIKENLFLSIFALCILIFLLIAFKEKYIQNKNNALLQFIWNTFSIFLPISITNLYLKLSQKEDELLLNFISKSELIKIRQVQSIISNLFIFIGFLIIGILPKFKEFSTTLLISGEILFLLFVSLVQPFFTYNKQYNFEKNKSYNLWNFKIQYHKILPVRGIVIREFLSLWRENKIKIFQFFFFIIVMNTIILLILLKNNLENYYFVGFFLQFIIMIITVLNFSIENDAKLLKTELSYWFDILKGEFVFWISLFILHLILVLPIYIFFIPNFSLQILFPLFLAVVFFLTLVLFIRLAFYESELIRALMFLIIVIPFSIPFIIYVCYRRLKC